MDPTASMLAYGGILLYEASYFGKDSLRMAGIVQMLHAHRTPYDKYPYAHRERTFKARRPRTQA
jgi:hypothetical protein